MSEQPWLVNWLWPVMTATVSQNVYVNGMLAWTPRYQDARSEKPSE